MITAKSTSGERKFYPGPTWPITAMHILVIMRDRYPGSTFDYVADAKTGERYKPEESVPDDTTVHVVSEMPTDA